MSRNYKKNRAKRRTPYEAYSYWYDTKTKSEAGKKKYYAKLTREEFEYEYNLVRQAGAKNPAKTIAEGQRKLSYKVQKSYEEITGRRITVEDIETKEAREALFYDLVDDLDGDYEEARRQFEAWYN